MSSTPPLQLGLLPGFDAPPLPSAAAHVEPVHEAPPRRAVSAERAMLAAQVTMAGLAVDPPEIQGWREELGRPRPRIIGGTCTAVYNERRRADGSIGPCPWAACKFSLLLDLGEPVIVNGQIRHELLLNRAGEHPAMGRRPALPAVPTDGEIDAFDLDAIARLDELPDTCQLDVQRRAAGHDADGMSEAYVGTTADAMGVSEEQIRIDTHEATAAIGVRMVDGQPVPGDPSIVEAILRRARGVSTPTAPPSKVGKPPPVPRALVREERDAPPPRSPTAGEIFTF